MAEYQLTPIRRRALEECAATIYPSERDQTILLRTIMDAVDYKDAEKLDTLVEWADALSKNVTLKNRDGAASPDEIRSAASKMSRILRAIDNVLFPQKAIHE